MRGGEHPEEERKEGGGGGSNRRHKYTASNTHSSAVYRKFTRKLPRALFHPPLIFFFQVSKDPCRGRPRTCTGSENFRRGTEEHGVSKSNRGQPKKTNKLFRTRK